VPVRPRAAHCTERTQRYEQQFSRLLIEDPHKHDDPLGDPTHDDAARMSIS